MYVRKRVYPVRARPTTYAPRRLPFKRARYTKTRIRKLPADETKIADIASANYLLNTTGTVNLVNAVALGSDNFNRIGRKLYMKYLMVRGSVRGVPATNTIDDYARMAIVYDKQPNLALPSYSDIFTSTTAAGATSSSSDCFTNESNKNRFIILKDYEIDFTGVYQGSNQFPTTVVKWYIPLKKKMSHYLGTTAAIGSISSGALYFVTRARNGTAGSENIQFTGTFRLAFTEG